MIGRNSPVSAICFDKDGTLFDFATTWEAWAAASVLRLAGRDPSLAAALGARVGFDLATRSFDPGSVVIAGTPDEVAAALGPALPELDRERIVAILDEEAKRAPQSPTVPLEKLLVSLRVRGLSLGVVTNDSEAPARVHIDGEGITDLFDFIAGFDSGHGAKPAPGPLLAFCKAVGVPPTRAVMVGDSLHDLNAGRAAGMRTVGVLTGTATRDTLAPLADVVLQNIGALPDWLDTL